MRNFTDLQHTYSNDIYYKKIVIVGPKAPPLGGISVHIERVSAKLLNQKNSVKIFDSTQSWDSYYTYLLRLVWFLMFNKPNILYYHTLYGNGISELLLLIVFKVIFFADLIIVDHDCRYLYKKNKKFKKYLNFLFYFVNQQVIIGDSTYQSYLDNNIQMNKSHLVESAFLPPDLSTENKIITSYPATLFKFLKTHKPIVTANAFKLSLIDNKDVYGFDLCVNLLRELKTDYGDIGLILALAEIGDKEYYQELLQVLRDYNLESSIFFLHGQKELWPLLKRSDLFLRPTLSDSYGISVAETLYFGKPAIASDVCARAKGTMVFKVGDKNDLLLKVKDTLIKNYSAGT